MNCYHDEELNFEGPVLFPWVEKTVVMTMVGSPRRDQYLRELERYRPTKRVVIQHNPGYKKCQKPGVHTVQEDLVFSTRRALREKCITLLLEDDVEFCPRLAHVAPCISLEDADAFSLGACILLATPGRFPRILVGSHAHAIIFSAHACELMQRQPHAKYVDFWLPMILKLRTYHRPLAIQKLLATEHSGNLFARQLCIKILRADSQPIAFYELSHRSAQLGGMGVVLGVILVVVCICLVKALMPRRVRDGAPMPKERGRSV